MAHLEATATGTWKVRYRDPAGRSRSRTFRLKGEANRFKTTVEADKLRGNWSDPQLVKVTIEAWAGDWFDSLSGLEPLTLKGYRSKIDRYIVPSLGHKAIGDIDRPMVKDFAKVMQMAGYSPSNIRQSCSVLRMVIDFGFERARIGRSNPALRMGLPTSSRRNLMFLTVAQVEGLALEVEHPPIMAGGGEHRAASFPQLGTLIRFAAMTGLRAGEMGALMTKRLDLQAHKVLVAGSMRELTGEMAQKYGGTLVIGDTKNHKPRTVAYPPFLADRVAALIEGRGPDDFVFTMPEGGPIRHSNFYTRHFKPAAVRMGLPNLRFHDLRHTCAALLISLGGHPMAIKNRLGHSSIQVTLDTYGHLFPELEVGLTNDLDALWSAGI